MQDTIKSISVVVPTYNASDILGHTLESLVDQTLGRDRYEVIVVDDGSSDNTEDVVRRFTPLLDIRYLYQEDLGFRVAAARNIGINKAKYDAVLFFDAGMIASKHLLEAHLKSHQQFGHIAVIGLSYGVNEFSTENFGPLSELLMSNSTDEVFQALIARPELYDCRFQTLSSIACSDFNGKNPWVVYWTGNASVGRKKLLEVNGFDEWFTSWGGEDVELGIRLKKNGCRFSLLPTVEAIHAPHDKDTERKIKDSRLNIEYICSKHPEQEYQLLQEYSWQDVVSLSCCQGIDGRDMALA